jgi:hypothetical protein
VGTRRISELRHADLRAGRGYPLPGSSRDVAHDKAAVDAGGCAVVFRGVGGRRREARFGGFVLEGVGVVQALQPPSRAACTPVGSSLGSPRPAMACKPK